MLKAWPLFFSVSTVAVKSVNSRTQIRKSEKVPGKSMVGDEPIYTSTLVFI